MFTRYCGNYTKGKGANAVNQFQDLPTEKSFGHEFDYAVWTANTTVTLANVPWNSDYRDLVRFDNRAALDNYLDTAAGPIISTTGTTYAAMGRPIALDIPHSRANRFNYLRATNPAQPISGGDTGQAFYYFITDVQYVAPNTTRFMLQLDVWQTFGHDVSFGNCYIERGHIGIANEESFKDNGREYLTQPEGLDMGGEYQIVDQWRRDIASARNKVPGDIGSYSILVTSTVDLTAAPSDENGPRLVSARGSDMENLPNGATSYVFTTLAHFKQFLSAFADKPWVTQGIISIMAIPFTGTYDVGSTSTMVAGVSILEVDPGSLRVRKEVMKEDWRDNLPIPERYAGLHKLKTYPYCVLEMTSYTGTPLVLKPESWCDPDGTVIEVPHFAQPGPRIMFYPYRYNAATLQNSTPAMDPVTDDSGVVNDGGEFLDMATGITNFPTFSLVNNGYMSFMASNHNAIAYQHSSADWAQQRALGGNQLSAEQATGAIGTSQDINQQGMSAARQSTNLANETGAFRAIQGMANSAIGGISGVANGQPGAAVGAIGGMANAAVGNAIDVNQRNQSLGISNTLAAGTNRAATDQMGYVRDTNKAYGDWAAKGDYQNVIAGINAKVQDAKLIQPTTAGQVGGDAFNLATNKWGYDIKVKMLQPASLNSIGEYWLRYGYSINRFGRMPENFMVMSKFTYWKLRETYISSSECPETFKQALRGIFEKGVTVWKNPTDIGNIDIADNTAIAGVTL